MDHIIRRARAKAAHVQHQLELLEHNQRALPQVGGVTFRQLADQIAFHRWRAQLLERVERATEPQIRAWLTAALAVLTPEERACVCGDARGLRFQAFRAVVAAELYQIALGEHQGKPIIGFRQGRE